MTISPHSNVRAALVQAAIAWLLAGCAAVPPYQPPRIPEVTGFTAGATPTATTRADGPLGNAQQVVDGTVGAQWWRALRSPALDALVEDALRASPTLAAARAALAQSRELHAAQAGSTQLPQVDLGLGAQRQQISPAAQGLPGDTREFSLYSASVGVRYRFDFGGGIDSGLQALGARADIRQHELAAARHALAANLATAAITRARLSAQIDAQTAILRAQEELVRLAEVRTRLGQAAPDEVSALTAQAELTRAGLPQMHRQMQQAEHLLAVLAGCASPPASVAPGAAPPRACTPASPAVSASCQSASAISSRVLSAALIRRKNVPYSAPDAPPIRLNSDWALACSTVVGVGSARAAAFCAASTKAADKASPWSPSPNAESSALSSAFAASIAAPTCSIQ